MKYKVLNHCTNGEFVATRKSSKERACESYNTRLSISPNKMLIQNPIQSFFLRFVHFVLGGKCEWIDQNSRNDQHKMNSFQKLLQRWA